jgi:hypothetical protein
MTYPMESIKENYKALRYLLDNLDLCQMEVDIMQDILYMLQGKKKYTKEEIVNEFRENSNCKGYEVEFTDKYKIVKYLINN